MPKWLAGLPLTHGPLHAALVVGALLALAGLLLRRGRRWWTHRVPAAVAAAVALTAAAWLYVDVRKPWPDGLPSAVLVWLAAGLLGMTLLVVGWRRRRWWVRALALLGAAVAVLGAADAVDTQYGAFPTVATALQLAPADTVTSSSVLRTTPSPDPSPSRPLPTTWRPPRDLPPHGAVFEADIPATRSRFPARPAWFYVPPAYLTAHHPPLPVLMMIGGQPGGPRDWLDGGQLAQVMDRWAAAHEGLAPVVVMPDALGGEIANPLCMDSALGRVDTYLTQDVTAWVTRHLQVDPNTAHWAVGGFSYGGTCALQLAVAHPLLFPTFLDESGQQTPSLGGGRARTVAATFGGNQAAFDAVDPMHELAVHRYPDSAGYFLAGTGDWGFGPQVRHAAAAARAAGMAVTYLRVPGGHNWDVWRPGFIGALPWLAARMGLIR